MGENCIKQRKYTNTRLCAFNWGYSELRKLLGETETTLRNIRGVLVKVRSVHHDLKTIRSTKKEHLEFVTDAADDTEVSEEYEHINDSIKKSVGTLIHQTCGSMTYTVNDNNHDRTLKTIMKMSPSHC